MKLEYISIFVLILLTSITMAENLSEERLTEIARQEMQRIVPSEIINEYSNFDIQMDAQSTVYWITWQREINGIPIYNDKFFVRIYPSGDIINHEYTYAYPSSEIDTSYTLTKEQAEWVAENVYGVVDGNDGLQIRDKTVLWVIRLDSGPIIGIDANTGESYVLATPLGSNIQQIATSFNPTAYYMETYGLYVIMGIIALAGGLLYWKRDLFIHKGR